MSPSSFKNNIIYKPFIYKSHIFNTYMYKQDLALDNPQKLNCHKTTNQPFLFEPELFHDVNQCSDGQC